MEMEKIRQNPPTANEFTEIEIESSKVKHLKEANDGRQTCNDCISGLACCTLCLLCINNLFFCCQIFSG